MASILKTDKIEGVTSSGTVQMPAGVVIQVARTYTADSAYVTAMSSTTLSASGIQCSITPKFSNSLILVDFSSSMATSGNNDFVIGRMYLKIGSASIAQMTGAAQYHIGFQRHDNNRYSPLCFSGSYTASSTDTLMFEPYLRAGSGNNAVSIVHEDGSSSLTVMEVAQ